mmetsp:Transcript_5159/g.10809  ORF Transcript_5159/g.10809 Transcript_5159/m.10809 type:complete len:244 (+) Transcript_5159:468-1199(+)
MKCLCNRWAISNLTELRDALDPRMSNQIVGCNPPSPSMRSMSMLPPATVKKGRTPANTTSTCSSSRGGPSGIAWMTSWISGIFSLNPRSSPIFIVCVDDGQVPHAPCSSNRTTGPSISWITTFPPSAIKKCRISSRTASTLSHVSSSGPSRGGLSVVVVEPLLLLLLLLSSPASNGETMSASRVLLIVVRPERPGTTVVNPKTDAENRGLRARRNFSVIVVTCVVYNIRMCHGEVVLFLTISA